MANVDQLLEKVDPSLSALIKASTEFRAYKQTTTIVGNAIEISGAMGVQINPRHPLGVVINRR